MEDNTTASFNWQSAIDETFTDFSQQLINYFPQLIGTIGVLLLGWLVAHTLSLSTRKVIQGLDVIFARFTRIDGINQERIQGSYSVIISKIVFWIVMIFFLTVAANILGWDVFAGWLDSIVSYLPGLISGLIIILGGFLLSNFAKATISSAADKAGMTQSAGMARAVQIVIIFSAIIIGVEQIGLNIGFLSNVIVASIAILLAGAALAFSLGAKNMVANIIGAQYTRKYCRVGDKIKIGDIEGEIIELAQACIVIETGSGQAIIPAKFFHEQVSLINA
jgi:small-conductance mechanosensitive channel